jgi:hypothetical protein
MKAVRPIEKIKPRKKTNQGQSVNSKFRGQRKGKKMNKKLSWYIFIGIFILALVLTKLSIFLDWLNNLFNTTP